MNWPDHLPSPPIWVSLLAGIIAVLRAAPLLKQLVTFIRNSGRSQQDILRDLRQTRGRVRAETWALPQEFSQEFIPWNLADSISKVRLTTERTRAVAYLANLLSHGQSVLLEGGAGAGKSALAQELRFYSFQESVESELPVIEIVHAHDFPSSRFRTSDFERWAVRTVARRHRVLSNAVVRGLILDTKLVLVVDGLDEAPTSVRERLIEGIANFARERPILVTTRTDRLNPQAGRSSGGDSLRNLLRLIRIEPLEWYRVRAYAEQKGVLKSIAIGEQLQRFLTNPLQLSVFLWAWKRTSDQTIMLNRLNSDPQELWREYLHLITAGVPGESLLRYAGVLAIRQSHETNKPFRPSPILLSGRIFGMTAAIAAPLIVALGIHIGFPILCIFLAYIVWQGTPSITDRTASRWADVRTESTALWLLAIAFVFFCVQQVITHAIWALQDHAHGNLDFVRILGSGWSLGDWAPYVWVGIGLWICNPYELGEDIPALILPRLLKASIGARVVVCGVSLSYLEFWNHGYELTAIILSISAGTTLLYASISSSTTWIIVGRPPWAWRSLRAQLIHSGALRGKGPYIRFLHAVIEDVIIQELSRRPSTPSLFWSVARPAVAGSIVRGPIDRPARADVIDQLARRLAWNEFAHQQLVLYIQRVRVDFPTALRYSQRRVQLSPRPFSKIVLADNLDMLGRHHEALRIVTKGLSAARKDDGVLYWSLRILVRQGRVPEAIRVAGQAITSMSAAQAPFARVLRFDLLIRFGRHTQQDLDALIAMTPLQNEVGVEASCVICGYYIDNLAFDRALQFLPPEEGDDPSLYWARKAQILWNSRDVNMAIVHAQAAASLLSHECSYDTILEVLITAHVVTGSDRWDVHLEKISAIPGWRLKGRSGLLDALRVDSADQYVRKFFDSSTPKSEITG